MHSNVISEIYRIKTNFFNLVIIENKLRSRKIRVHIAYKNGF